MKEWLVHVEGQPMLQTLYSFDFNRTEELKGSEKQGKFSSFPEQRCQRTYLAQIYQSVFTMPWHLLLIASQISACHYHILSSPQARVQPSITPEKRQVHSPTRAGLSSDHSHVDVWETGLRTNMMCNRKVQA